VPDGPGEVIPVQQEPGDDRRETDDGQNGASRGSEKEGTNIPLGSNLRSKCAGLFLAAKEKQKLEKSPSMKLLTWKACRLLAGGREPTLVNLLQAIGADIDTISECKIPEGTGEFSVAS
jgi:hypothetical protein